jgi:hypothetical protein
MHGRRRNIVLFYKSTLQFLFYKLVNKNIRLHKFLFFRRGTVINQETIDNSQSLLNSTEKALITTTTKTDQDKFHDPLPMVYENDLSQEAQYTEFSLYS